MSDGLRHPHDDLGEDEPWTTQGLIEEFEDWYGSGAQFHPSGRQELARETVRTLRDLAVLESIVRDFAASLNPAHIDDGALSPVCCDFCDACPPETGEVDDAGNRFHRAPSVEDHELTCPWRRAVEFVSAHPGAGDD